MLQRVTHPHEPEHQRVTRTRTTHRSRRKPVPNPEHHPMPRPAPRPLRRRALLSAGASGAALGLSALTAGPAAASARGFRVWRGQLLDGRGRPFVMRGANHGHAWYPERTHVWADMAAAGANTIRVVTSGGRWGTTSAQEISAIIDRSQQHRMVCVLENHDTTGYGDDAAATSLEQAAQYWVSVRQALKGRERHALLNIGNEPLGNALAAQWTEQTVAAVRTLRRAGIRNTLVVDAPNWGQDWSGTMREGAPAVLRSDPHRNVVFSVHMYGVYDTGEEVRAYVDSFHERGLPLIVGEFGHDHSDGPVDEDAIFEHTARRRTGWLAWSWSGNSGGVEYLDMVEGFDASRRTWWGERVVSGPHGWSTTSRPASTHR